MFLFNACASTSGKKIPQTQLQIREFQTRSFEIADSKMVMKAMVNVLQDEGFIISNASSDLGFLSASRESDVQKGGEKFFSILFGNGHYKKAAVTECTANVSEHGKQTKVRVNFRNKVLDNVGNIKKLDPIFDPVFYQDFFSKVDKGIFLQKEKI